MSGAFGTSSRRDRERRRKAVSLHHGGDVEHDRRWMVWAVVIAVAVLLFMTGIL